MRVIAFPGRQPSRDDAATIAELEAALDGDGTGAAAEQWRELRADVRALAQPIDPRFAHALEQRVRDGKQPETPQSRRVPIRGRSGRRAALAAAGALALALAGVVASGALSSHAQHGISSAPRRALGTLQAAAPPESKRTSAAAKRAGEPLAATSSQSDNAEVAGPSLRAVPGEVPGEGAGRLQQLGASITLSAGGGEAVQRVAERVGRVTLDAGGFVASSRVQLQQGAAGEALLTLRLPSARLPGALAQLEQLAPVRAETQSLQDLTGQYDAVSARLSAQRGERAALLRALANASTSTAIETLRARLAQVGGEIAATERQQASIARSASEAQVEVTVLGEAARHHSGGLSLGQGVTDAGNVLSVSLAALVIGLAVLVPLALLVAALLLGARQWHRLRRERALGPS